MICLVIATHRRVEITKNLIQKLLKEQNDIEIVVSVTDPEEAKQFKNCHIVLCSNKPLGNKWQKAIDKAKELNPEGIIILGSDDELCEGYVDNIRHLHFKGFHFIGVKQYYVKHNRKLYFFNYKPDQPIGGGRFYSKALLDKIKWNVFKRNYNKCLDDYGFKQAIDSQMRMAIITNVNMHDLKVIANKGSWPMMNPFNPAHQNLSLICVE